MIKDFFQSFKDDFHKRTTNPFLGTYLLVTIIRNWRILFILFNFDTDYSLNQKLSIIDEYFDSFSIFHQLFHNIGYTFIILIATYFLLNLARLITNFFEKTVTPWVLKISDSKNIIEKRFYDEAKGKIDKLKNSDEDKARKIESLESKLEKLEMTLRDSKEKLKIREKEYNLGKLIYSDLKYSFLKFTNDQ